MKIGKMFRWYWQNTYWGLVGFYGAMLFLMLLGFVIMVFSSTEEVSVNGFAFSAEIMLLVMGIIFFPTGTRFGLSNGVSRKTVFCGMVLFLLALSPSLNLVPLKYVLHYRLFCALSSRQLPHVNLRYEH